MKPLIVIGDKTSHGGTVITCSQLSATEGKGWARVGDMVSCPRCKGVFPIVEGDVGFLDDGHAVAYDGCKTACGALLVASQQMTLTAPVNGGASAVVSDAPSTSLQGFGVVAAGLASRYHDEPVAQSQGRFRGRFQLVNAATGAPVRSQAVRVRSTGGQYITGTTDADGYTTWVDRDAREALAFELVQDGDA
ncbi:PAAR domain-containing protein [Massilia rhizosphaerae]|uniref:PAAR domain-containing protein n=1 Tax=Massilia rhizosphaerae TaxID=2784389 RepID=UPI001E29A9AF|nr:PAAR domain-containing protein [Massilia rhizosphaerae]